MNNHFSAIWSQKIESSPAKKQTTYIFLSIRLYVVIKRVGGKNPFNPDGGTLKRFFDLLKVHVPNSLWFWIKIKSRKSHCSWNLCKVGGPINHKKNFDFQYLFIGRFQKYGYVAIFVSSSRGVVRRKWHHWSGKNPQIIF